MKQAKQIKMNQTEQGEMTKQTYQKNRSSKYAVSVQDTADARRPAIAAMDSFPLSKARLAKKDVVYSGREHVCVRIREKMARIASAPPVYMLYLTQSEFGGCRPLRAVGQARRGQRDGREAASVDAGVPRVCAVDALAAGDQVRVWRRR